MGIMGVVQHLRSRYGESIIDSELKDHWGFPVRIQNPNWYLDRPRRRIWVTESVLTMMSLSGVDTEAKIIV